MTAPVQCQSSFCPVPRHTRLSWRAQEAWRDRVGSRAGQSVWAASLGPAPWHLPGLPPHSFPPSSESVKVTQTNMVSQHFAFRVLCFRRRRGSFRPTAPPPPRQGARIEQGPAPYSPQPPQTPPISWEHKHTPDPAKETLIYGSPGWSDPPASLTPSPWALKDHPHPPQSSKR